MSAVATAMPTPATKPDGPAPRKRRKRASAAGATDDCFTCSSRGYNCDRRRPYCSRCLEDGKDCSGYKTQLTWGVGVASRGKLRGLSLPVAGTKRAPNTSASSSPKRGHRPSASISSLGTKVPASALSISIPSPDSSRSTVSAQRDKHSISPPPLTSPFPPAWETPAFMPHSAPPYQDGFAFDTQTPVTSAAFSFPPSTSTIYSPVDPTFQLVHQQQEQLSTQRDLSPPARDNAFSRPPNLSIPIPPPQLQQSYAPFTPFDTAFDHLSPFQAPFPQQDESFLRGASYDHSGLYQSAEPSQAPLNGRHSNYGAEDDIEEVVRPEIPSGSGDLEETEIWTNSVVLSSSPMGYTLNPHIFSSGSGIGRTPRLQFLINYYSEVISPVIVAFDGPNNPYRNNILRLAADSDALQHAIAALAASNLRQRQESGALSTCKTAPARRSSMAHLTLADSWHEELFSPMDLAREETSLKNFAVQSLNRQLADPVGRKKDSTLAVLLMLSLFHTCATGVAKFKTQFAGVRKLLTLRAAANEPVSAETKFFTSMFAWFDSITASVNDREGQFLSHHLDLSSLTDSAWSLENLAGCDGSLFRIIAKLARLNVLSQGKPVEEKLDLVSRPVHPIASSLCLNDSPIDLDLSRYDGNGWSTFSDDGSFPEHKNGPLEQFWHEWSEVRHSLQSWTLPPPAPTSTLSVEQRADLANISECFRYSALVYTERLANPSVPCTSLGIQRWVQQSLHYISLVKSDVYLLWPLFVTGAECVSAEDRQVVRGRCQDIQKDSGFVNNASCLGLLEAVWKQMDRHGASGGEAQGFRFTEIMKRADDQGEYIVV